MTPAPAAAAIEQFALVDQPATLADQIALITGQTDRPWDCADDLEDTRIKRLGFRLRLFQLYFVVFIPALLGEQAVPRGQPHSFVMEAQIRGISA
jgi:hypothetical protein